MKNIRLTSKSTPWVLLIACVLAFGLFIPWLGFYQDDWYQIWFRRAFGPQIFIDYYSYERPFIAALYMLTTPLVGTTPLAWQIFGLLSRWLAVLAVWWFLRLIWPRYSHQTAWAALLFALYPGFRIQYASVIYSHYFLQLAIQIGSLGAMLLAYRELAPRRTNRFWLLNIVAVLGSAFGLFTSEYFFGLELARPVFLWLETGQGDKPARTRLQQVLRRWWPYLLVLASFLVWRLFVFQFPTYQPIYKQYPEAGLLGWAIMLARTIAGDVIEMGVSAWGMTLNALVKAASMRPVALAGAALTLVAGLALFVYLRRLEPEQNETGRKTGDLPFAWPAILLGLFLLLAAGWPFWFVDLKVNTALNGGSRFGISFMLGSALLVTGLIDLMGRREALKIGMVALLAGLAIGFHFQDGDFFREVNRTQASFFQQLAWRAPGLKSGTLVLTNSFENHVMSGDNSLTAALNWIYEPQPPYALDYVLFYIPTRIETGDLTTLEAGQPFERRFRTAEFHSSTDHALVLFYPYPNCLRVLDPVAHQDLPRPVDMPRELKTAIPISNLDQIMPDADPPASLPPELFKVKYEPGSWCYDYEKAELARQQGDWGAIVRLADHALSGEQKFRTTWELLPYIEGYARAGQSEKARQLSLQVSRFQPEGRAGTQELLCRLWARLEVQAGANQEFSALADDMQNELNCE